MLTRILLAFSLFFAALASPAAAQPVGSLPSATSAGPATIVPCATAGVAGSTKGCTAFQVAHAGGGDCEIGNYCPVDPAGTNYLFQSNNLDTSPWTTSNVTVGGSSLAGMGSIGLAWDLTSTSTGGFIQQITPLNSIPADTRTYILSAYFDKTRSTTPWTISFFFAGGPSNTMVYTPGTDTITSCVGGGTCGRQFVGNKVRLWIAAPNASFTRATVKIYPTGTLGTTGLSTVDNVQLEAATGATQLTAPTCINRTTTTAIARTGVCGQSGASLTGDQAFSGVNTFTKNLLFTRYPLTGNPTMIFGGPTTAISPNNAFIELDCKVEVSNVCAIVPIQSNQFATGAARQPDIIGWRGSCAVDGTWVIPDWSACIAHTGHATFLAQGSIADGYHPYSKSVTVATVSATGSGYTAGDILTVTGGTVSTREGANSVAAKITVDTVSGGAVATYHVSNIGAYVADVGFPLPVNPVAVTGGTGTGATFNLTFNNHANATSMNIITQVDSLCGSPSAWNAPGRIKLGVEDPYSGATFPTLAPDAMNYSIDIRCDNSIVFIGGPTANGGSGGGLYYTPFGTNTRTRFLDLNTGLIDNASLPLAASGVKGAVTPDGTATHFLNGAGAWTVPAVGGTGTVTSVSVTTANGVSGSVATATTTPAISLTLGAITPSSVAASGTVTGSNLSGTNTGDQTITLTGPITGSGTGSVATTITAGAVTYPKIQNVAASSLLGNPTGSIAAPSEIALGSSFTLSGSTLYGAVDHPGYVSGRWYNAMFGASIASGSAITGGQIRLNPFIVSKPITPTDLALRITTLSVSGNVQAAIYGTNYVTVRPTGNAICTSASMSTTTAVTVSGTATCSSGLLPGLYWAGINSDNSTAAFQSAASSLAWASALVGSTTLTNVSSGATATAYSLSVTQSFGTWPDLTSASFTEVIASGVSPILYMKAQ